MIVAAISQLLWLNFATITTPQMENLFGVSKSDIGLLSAVWPLLFIPLSIPTGMLVDTKGFKLTVTFGAAIMALFAVLRIFSGEDFTLLLIFQAGAALGQPFVFNGISKLATLWFPLKERALATGLGTMGLFLGMITALTLTPFLVPEGATLTQLTTMLVIYAVVSLVGVLVFIVLAREKPAIPPEVSEAEMGATFSLRGMGRIARSKDFVILEVLFFIGVGLFTGLAQWIESILVPRGISSTDAGIIAGLIIVGGIIGSIVVPEISDRIMRRKPFAIIGLGVAAFMLFYLAVGADYTLLLIASFILGFFLMPALPIGLEMSAELVGPVMAGSASSLLWLFSQVGSLVLIVGMESLSNETLYPENPFYLSVILILILDLVALALCFVLKETGRKPVT
ncbi:MAG: MFS transporter [Candidatus Bathyarchaeia archaeon]